MKRAIAALLLVGATTARAEPSRRHLIHHAALTAGGALAVLLSETAFKADLAPAACRWCAPPAFDGAMRDALVWRRTDAANTLSNVGVAIAPVISLAAAAATWRDDGRAEAIDDGLDLVESGVLALAIGQVVKFSAGRERPFVYAAAPGRAHDLDDDVSFFSAHTALSFSLVTAAGTIASRRDQRLAPWIWGGGLALAGTIGYLRIAADRHWTTDVLAGAAVGAASGLLVPRLLHDHDLTLVPLSNGVALTGTF